MSRGFREHRPQRSLSHGTSLSLEDQKIDPHQVQAEQPHNSLGFQDREYPQSQNLYVRLSHSLGFKAKFSLASFIFFGGAMLGFCLSRLIMFPPSALEHKTAPGEWFWYRQPLYRPNITIHIVLTTLAGILSGLQFLPSFQTGSKAILHRVNGYIVVALLVPAMITGGIVARHSFGGEINTQSAFYTLAILISLSALLGIWYRKDIPKHRRWMLRSAFYLGSVLTARIIKMIAVEIITNMGGFYSIWSCEEIAFVLGANTTAYKRDYPECKMPEIRTAVLASLHGSPVNVGSTVRCTFGMALWIGLIIHAIGVEFYIFSTEMPNTHQISGTRF